jgi:hypothetical protein
MLDAPRGRLPDFLIIGAAKCGTSTLFRYLRRHPAVFGSEPKEPCFFDPAVSWNRGFDWYRGLFAGARDDQICGEASTNYTRFPQVPGVPERIREAIPEAKLIYLVRHPVERAYSHYLHRHTKELHHGEPIRTPFEEFVVRDPMCLDGSDYALQIERYLERFPREQLLLLRMDELRRSPRELLTRVQRFLDLPEQDLVGAAAHAENETKVELHVHARRHLASKLKRVPGVSSLARTLDPEVREKAVALLFRTPWGARVERGFEPPPMRAETRARLIERFTPSIRRLEALMGEALPDFYV